MDDNQNIETTAEEQPGAEQQHFAEKPSLQEITHAVPIEPLSTEQQNKISDNGINQNTNDNSSMEVHHSKHLTHKKKWSEYLLEFLMLFLAVFLGFIAENIRETSVERHREKAYIQNMVQNLKDDTAQLNQDIPEITLYTQKLDTLAHLSKLDFAVPENLKALTKLTLEYAVYYYHFTANNAALTQLKSGNLRLIQRGHVADSILKYDLMNSTAETQWQQYHLIFNDYILTLEQTFDITILLDTTYTKDRKLSDKLPPAVTTDKEKLKLYFNKVIALLVSSGDYLKYLKVQSNYARSLIAYLTKEYHLEDE